MWETVYLQIRNGVFDNNLINQKRWFVDPVPDSERQKPYPVEQHIPEYPLPPPLLPPSPRGFGSPTVTKLLCGNNNALSPTLISKYSVQHATVLWMLDRLEEHWVTYTHWHVMLCSSHTNGGITLWWFLGVWSESLLDRGQVCWDVT